MCYSRVKQLRNFQSKPREAAGGRYAADLSCNCRLAGPVPLRFSALSARANEEQAAVHLAVSID
jgi:hypothetical protein